MAGKTKLRRLTKGGGIPLREVNTEKYFLETCQDEIDRRGSTAHWIDIVKAFKKISDPRDIDLQKSQILKAVKDGSDIIVKIGANSTIEHEYRMGAALSQVKGFAKFICYFTCNDNFYRYFEKDSGHICDGPGTSMKVILMPYFPEGNLGRYAWTTENVHVMRSCIKMACLSLCEAFERKNIVHGDFHPENVMLKKTKQASIDFDGTTIKTHGYRTWIMDFEVSYKFDKHQSAKAKVDFFYDLKKFFFLLNTFVPSIDKVGINAMSRFFDGAENGGLDKNAMCEAIDSNVYLG